MSSPLFYMVGHPIRSQGKSSDVFRVPRLTYRIRGFTGSFFHFRIAEYTGTIVCDYKGSSPLDV
jgi:hypothetical protein